MFKRRGGRLDIVFRVYGLNLYIYIYLHTWSARSLENAHYVKGISGLYKHMSDTVDGRNPVKVTQSTQIVTNAIIASGT